jgi:large repetitive protein
MMLLPLVLMIGCGSKEDTSIDNRDIQTEPAVEIIDEDQDGFGSEEDCDDTDPNINPTTEEICDGIDNNCDEEIDEGVTNTFYTDSDGDGFGDEEKQFESCQPEAGQVEQAGDCDDTDPNINPTTEEICDDIDNNCDSNIDEDLLETWFLDLDNDGFGTTPSEVCPETDGYAIEGNDCDDNDPSIHPEAEETCDEIDNNCDGNIDEDLALPQYLDSDADGHGDISSAVWDCEKIPGTIYMGGDCDDSNPNINSSAPDLCNAIDDNCDGILDNEPIPGAAIIYLDADEDGYGDPNIFQQVCATPCMPNEECSSPVDGYVFSNSDCDDQDATINSAAVEVCDSVDENCNNIVDDNPIDGQLFYIDGDGDGYGADETEVLRCTAVGNEISQGGDCNDSNDEAYPNAQEICDGVDNDCDELIDDEDDNTIPPAIWYMDADNDGYGDPLNTTTGDCELLSEYTTDNTDCDDSNDQINPLSSEICNELDDNCDGTIDEDIQVKWYADDDNDTFGAPGTEVTLGCTGPVGFVTNDFDCDDDDDSVNPNADEECDFIDNNCNNQMDEGLTILWYQDDDGDGYGEDSTAIESCMQPSNGNFVSEGGDCDDLVSPLEIAVLIFPGATEICDGLDYDCDGIIDNLDADEDGYIAESCGGDDCDDSDEDTYPDEFGVCPNN